MASYCAAGQLPVVRLTLQKQACVRGVKKTNTVEGIVRHVSEAYGCQPQEFMLAVALSSAMEPLALIEVAMGAMDQTMVDPRVLFSGLLLAGATAFVLFHNHPSGDPEPSAMDIQLTKQLVQGARLLALRCMDHIVVGADGRTVSFASRGILPQVS